MVSLPASRLVNTVLDALGHEAKAPLIAVAFATWTLSVDREIAQEAATITDHVVRALSPTEVLRLEQHRRDASPDPRRQAWGALRPADVARFEAFGAASTALFCLLTMHPNGHVRQASVERLSFLRDGVEMPFLLARVNDWVRPVRAAAKLSVVARIVEAQQGHLVRGRALLACLPLFDRLGSLGRDDHGPLRAAFEALLGHPAFAPVLEKGMYAPSRAVRFRCYRTAVSRPGSSVRLTLRHALGDRDASIRLWAARSALKQLTGDELREAVETMRRDGSGAVRNEAIFALAKKMTPPDREALEHAMLDPSATVRWTACQFLAERWKVDARPYYLAALEQRDPAILAAAIAGLAECIGHPEDEAHALALLHHTSTDVRRAALGALDKLAGNRRVNQLLDALRDPRASVAREAAVRLKAHINDVDPARLEALLREPRPHTRRMALRLATTLPRKRSIGLLVEAVLDPDAMVVAEATRSIQSWVGWARGSKLIFDPEEPPRIERAVEKARPVIGERVADTLIEILRKAPR